MITSSKLSPSLRTPRAPRQKVGVAALLFLTLSMGCNKEEGPKKSKEEIAYNSLCAGCHLTNGQGIPGTYPKLNGHVQYILAVDEGRDYLLQVATHGVSGSINVDGVDYNNVMPPLAAAPHGTVADALSFVLLGWDNPPFNIADLKPYTAEEVKAARSVERSLEDVRKMRPKVMEAQK